MKLPSSFTDYTRALLGVEEYEKLARGKIKKAGRRPGRGAAGQYPTE